MSRIDVFEEYIMSDEFNVGSSESSGDSDQVREAGHAQEHILQVDIYRRRNTYYECIEQFCSDNEITEPNVKDLQAYIRNNICLDLLVAQAANPSCRELILESFRFVDTFVTALESAISIGTTNKKEDVSATEQLALDYAEYHINYLYNLDSRDVDEDLTHQMPEAAEFLPKYCVEVARWIYDSVNGSLNSGTSDTPIGSI